MLILFIFGSCQPNEQTTQQVQIELIDAAAATEIMMIGSESGVISLYPWGTLGVLSAAAIYGAQMSHEAGQHVPRPGNDFMLPDNYQLSTNPYECIGYSHNRNLDYFSHAPGSAHAVANLHEEELRQTIVNYAACNPEVNVDSVMAFANSQAFRDLYFGMDRTQYANQTLDQVLLKKSQTDTSGVAGYLISFINSYRSHFGESSNYQAKINYINEEIRNRLLVAEYPNRKEQKLIFLTVLKHSVYYWR